MGYYRRIIIFLISVLFICTLNATHKGEVDPPKIVVDLSDNTLKVFNDGILIKTFTGIQHGSHISDVPYSLGTPVIECMAKKEPDHRFGPVFRLCYGEDGDRQGSSRGILIHRDMSSRSKYTRGCVALRSYAEMKLLYKLTPNLVLLVIQK